MLKRDFQGDDPQMLQNGDGDIVGPAGQKVTSAAKPGTEQIAAWGGFTVAEDEANETSDKPLSAGDTGWG
jgi:hypothetical protein